MCKTNETILTGNCKPEKLILTKPGHRELYSRFNSKIFELFFIRNDHTQGNINGIYIYIESSLPTKFGDKALLESSYFLPTPSYGLCMDFWYSMNGLRTGDLNVYINASNTLTLLWWQSGNKGLGWYNARLKIMSSTGYRIAIEGIVGDSYTSDIALDDIEFLDKSCFLQPPDADPSFFPTKPPRTTRPMKPPNSPFDCNFEVDFCNYTIDSKESDFSWERVQGKKGESIAGPLDADNTLGTSEGWYIYAPVFQQKLGDKALIESPELNGPKCLTFYFYLQSNTPFSLKVYIKLGSQLGSFVWRRTSSQGGFWKLGRLSVNSGFGAYKVVFELQNNGYGSSNDVYAIDDIRYSDQSCLDGSMIDEVCTFTSTNTCGYTIDTSNSFQWRLYNPTAGRAESHLNRINLLPFDHTTDGVGSGYLYADSTNQMPNRTAIFISPTYLSDNNKVIQRCLEFYFYLLGTNAINLNIEILSLTSGHKSSLWSRDYDHSKHWWKGEIDIRSASDFQLIFEAISRGSDGLIGIDDISLKGENCAR